MTESARSQHWLALDGLRGAACLMVLVYHFVPFAPTHSRLTHLVLLVAHSTWVGVDLFFVLSGFLITNILVAARGSTGMLQNFYARRVLRIFPLYYAVLIARFVVVPRFAPPYVLESMRDTFDHQGWLWAYAYNLRILLTGKFWGDDWIPVSHLWSLAVEEHFYLVWPLLVAWFDRSALRRIAIAAIALAPLMRTACVMFHVSPAIVFSFTPFRMDSLLLGALLALTYEDARYAAVFERFAPALLATGVALFVLLALSAGRPSALSAPMSAVGFTAIGLASVALVVLAIQSGPSRLKRVLETKALRWVGRYSYGAYILHELFQPAIARWISIERIHRFVPSELLSIATQTALAIAWSLALAVVSFRLLEAPFLRLKRFFEYGRPPRNPATASHLP